MIKSRDKKVLMWVDPSFKSSLKIRAAEQDISIIKLTKKLACDKEVSDDKNIRY
jgi:hypothetical protein